MRLREFLEIKELIREHNLEHKGDREFALKYKELLKKPMKLLDVWRKEHLYRLKDIDSIDRFNHILMLTSILIVVIGAILGFLAGVGLLSYSGKELINILYFLIFAFLLPFITGVATLFSIFAYKSKANYSILHSTPAFWFQKLIYRFLGDNFDISRFKLPLPILNLKLIKLSIYFSLSFYTALGLALIVMVISEDIAFGWRSTLSFSPQEFLSYMEIIATPWRFFIPSGVPSLELIEQSHYFRLGGTIDSNLVKNASHLGEWWRFLFYSILFYGVIFRIVLLLLVKVKLKKEIKESIVAVDGIKELLENMQTQFISTQTEIKEQPLTYDTTNTTKEESQKEQSLTTNNNNIGFKSQNIVGWGLSLDEIRLFADRFEIEAENIYSAGGNNSIDEDLRVVDEVEANSIIFIKSWEPPMMDFTDFIEELEQKGVEVLIYPIGLEVNNFIPKSEDIAIWQDKLSFLNLNFKIKK